MVEVVYIYAPSGAQRRTGRRKRIIPVQLGYVTKGGIARMTPEYVMERWAAQNKSSRAEFKKVHGFAALKPQRERKGKRVFRRGRK